MMIQAQTVITNDEGRLGASHIKCVHAGVTFLLLVYPTIYNRIMTQHSSTVSPQIHTPINSTPFVSLKIETWDKWDVISLIFNILLGWHDCNSSDDKNTWSISQHQMLRKVELRFHKWLGLYFFPIVGWVHKLMQVKFCIHLWRYSSYQH